MPGRNQPRSSRGRSAIARKAMNTNSTNGMMYQGTCVTSSGKIIYPCRDFGGNKKGGAHPSATGFMRSKGWQMSVPAKRKNFVFGMKVRKFPTEQVPDTPPLVSIEQVPDTPPLVPIEQVQNMPPLVPIAQEIQLPRPISNDILQACPDKTYPTLLVGDGEREAQVYYVCESTKCYLGNNNPPDYTPCPPSPGCPQKMTGYKNSDAWLCCPKEGYVEGSGCTILKSLTTGLTACNLSPPNVSGYCKNLGACNMSLCNYATGKCDCSWCNNYTECEDNCKSTQPMCICNKFSSDNTIDKELDYGTFLFPGYDGWVSVSGGILWDGYKTMTCDCSKNTLIPYKDPITCEMSELSYLLNSIEGGAGTWGDSATTKFVAYEMNATANYYTYETSHGNSNAPGNLTIHNKYFFPNGRMYFDNAKNDIRWISNYYSSITDFALEDDLLHVWVRGLKLSNFNGPVNMLHPYFFYGVPGNDLSYSNIDNIGLHRKDAPNFALDMELNTFPFIDKGKIQPLKFPIDKLSDSNYVTLIYRNIRTVNSQEPETPLPFPNESPYFSNNITISYLDSSTIISSGHYYTGSVNISSMISSKNTHSMLIYDSRVWNFTEPKTCDTEDGMLKCDYWQYGAPSSFITTKNQQGLWNTNATILTDRMGWRDAKSDTGPGPVLADIKRFGCDALGLNGLRCWNAKKGQRGEEGNPDRACNTASHNRFPIVSDGHMRVEKHKDYGYISGPLQESAMRNAKYDDKSNAFSTFITSYSPPADISCNEYGYECLMYMPTELSPTLNSDGQVVRKSPPPAPPPYFNQRPVCPKQCLTCNSSELQNGICTKYCSSEGSCGDDSGGVDCSSCDPEVNGYAILADIHKVDPPIDMSYGYVPIQCAAWEDGAIAWHTTFTAADPESLKKLDPNAWGIYYKWMKFTDQPNFASIPSPPITLEIKKQWQKKIEQLHKDMEANNTDNLFGYVVTK